MKNTLIKVCLFVLAGAACCFNGIIQASSQGQTPPANEAHFHHLHLNTLDPKAAIEFYTSRFDSEKARFAGLLDAVWAQKSWILFSKVSTPPVSDLTSSIWHFGWGAENMKAEYERQQKLGTKFHTPLTDISDIGGNTGAKDLFYYAYVESPDKALIELNTANHHRFGHLHLFSTDPIAAGEWYVKHFGAKGRIPTSRTPRMYRGFQIGPSVSLMVDNVNIIIFPAEYLKAAEPTRWKDKVELESTKGHVVDHIGFSFDNLSEALEKMRKDGVKVTDEIRSLANGKIKFAFVEGPDKIRIELVEGHAKKE
ncbi:MAG TPA: VOC family protein, partial [Blastocatellia bacterium]|nr:VOC family protein [Blastocatellia bacterium]HMV82797.1 VOC family protein [Blastocatellia bacterium]HMX27428.1 VOC family protein [Blastocatellia bacterium]HMY74013.1 VOC family protein [Blastocatellia bacterium]HMZ21402.1 VOC family protein [Blastocatellia bacterium]